MYIPLDSFLLRAPLLPERAMAHGRTLARALARHPLGEAAIALASETLAAGADSAERRRALGRYARRAAFRATPQGLLAGVCVGRLGRPLRVATGAPDARLAPTWARMAALGRALLDEPEVRAQARLRQAPSLLRAPGRVRWLGPGDPFGATHEAEPDARLAAILDAAAGWAHWPAVRRACGGDAGDADELLLVLVDQGLLHADVLPPLVGAPADRWMAERLEALGRGDEAARLARARAALDGGDLAAGLRALAELPGGGEVPPVAAVLAFEPRRPPVLPRAAVERAAALVPLLFRLQQALAPPALERLAQPGLGAALASVTETFGAGALDAGALETGDYGVQIHEHEDEDGVWRVEVPGRLLALLVDAVVAAASEGRPEAALDAAALGDALDDDGVAPPATCELFLSPGPAPPGAPAGTGWLLGLHAPAGASWGRFAAALGTPLARALTALAEAERAARPFEERLDVAFAPSPALAELCAHPPVRARALALSGWSAAGDDLTARDLELLAHGASPSALRARGGTAPLVPSPLARVRSTTAPAGLTRLLAGWSLQRQHAPWALAAGPLAALARVPRLSIDGFVVAPASWLVPAELRDGTATAAAIRRWRRAAGLPRWVQVGEGDQLLPVDLQAPDAAADLRRHERAWEIWPPLGQTADRDGRRIEAVVALVDRPDAATAAELGGAARATVAAGLVPPPREAPPLPGWRTYKLFGPADLQDQLLAGAVEPVARAARAAREIRGWSFLRYVDAPGARPHLRLRVESRGVRARAAFEARLEAGLGPFRAAGAVVTVETADYHPERARFGGTEASLAAVHAVFESDSQLACALIRAEAGQAEPDRVGLLVRSLDALAHGLGLDAAARHALARAQRAAEERWARVSDERDRAYRARARGLRAALAGARRSPGDRAARALAAHTARVARATTRLPPGARVALAPALLHFACVRLVGPDRDAELDAYTFWERTLEGLLRAPPREAL